ncbi:MAG: hypothetical protein AABW65_00780 [Nanoarchaeota archaeon]
MMNKKGESDFGEILLDNTVYVILLAIFVFGIFAFVYQLKNGAVIWEDYYAKEVSKVLNFAEKGDNIEIDVQKASEIAGKNRVELSEMFSFKENDVCVKLSKIKKTCYVYFNDIKILSSKIKEGTPVNILSIQIGGKDE